MASSGKIFIPGYMIGLQVTKSGTSGYNEYKHI
jgi:hypothetical protein